MSRFSLKSVIGLVKLMHLALVIKIFKKKLLLLNANQNSPWLISPISLSSIYVLPNLTLDSLSC
ncbi:Uncharacterized protein TCM_019391 [Theobroma cacao]|uniref:Uncharacterized protein n=1 Tax=Theobroma cacao TaxID=3641 RepID=A0A061EGZ5_THECC|nr:Uncharacterized protein TCM_019391 [Theobroma cacao]